MTVIEIPRRFAKKIRDAVLYDRSPKWLASPEYADRFTAKWHKVFDRRENLRPNVRFSGALVADLHHGLGNQVADLAQASPTTTTKNGCFHVCTNDPKGLDRTTRFLTLSPLAASTGIASKKPMLQPSNK